MTGTGQRPDRDPPAADPAAPDEREARPATVRCPYCDRPFASDRLRAIHLGEVHPGACTDAERAAYERALDEEGDELFRYHVKVIAALVVLTFGLVYAYVFVLA
jgi:hypothetical protein